MSDGSIEIRVIDSDSVAKLRDLLERMEDGDVWSVKEAADELREILLCLNPSTPKR